MKIRITRGIYGFRENGNVVEKTKNDPPFEVNDEEGERLLSLNVAESVSSVEKTTASGAEKETDTDGNASENTSDLSESISREDLEKMSKVDLYRLAEKYGIRKNVGKTEMVEQLVRKLALYEDEELMDESEMPELKAEDPE